MHRLSYNEIKAKSRLTPNWYQSVFYKIINNVFGTNWVYRPGLEITPCFDKEHCKEDYYEVHLAPTVKIYNPRGYVTEKRLWPTEKLQIHPHWTVHCKVLEYFDAPKYNIEFSPVNINGISITVLPCDTEIKGCAGHWPLKITNNTIHGTYNLCQSRPIGMVRFSKAR